MNKRKLDYRQSQIDMFRETDEARAYLEYNEKVGGEPIGLFMPFGYPEGVEEMGGVIAVYKECIKKGVTWETLLDFKFDDDVMY